MEAGVDPDARLGNSRLEGMSAPLPGLRGMGNGAKKRKRGWRLQVEELKKRIHKELFGEGFPTAPPVLEWKAQQKDLVIAHSVQIMLRHNQTERRLRKCFRRSFS